MEKDKINLDNVLEVDAEPEFKEEPIEEPEKPKEPLKPVSNKTMLERMLEAEILYKKALLKERKAQSDLSLQEAYKWVELSTDGKDKDLGLTNDTKRASWVKTQVIKFTDDVFKSQEELIIPEAEYKQFERLEKRERLEIMVRLFASKQEMNMLLDILK